MRRILTIALGAVAALALLGTLLFFLNPTAFRSLVGWLTVVLLVLLSLVILAAFLVLAWLIDARRRNRVTPTDDREKPEPPPLPPRVAMVQAPTQRGHHRSLLGGLVGWLSGAAQVALAIIFVLGLVIFEFTKAPVYVGNWLLTTPAHTTAPSSVPVTQATSAQPQPALGAQTLGCIDAPVGTDSSTGSFLWSDPVLIPPSPWSDPSGKMAVWRLWWNEAAAAGKFAAQCRDLDSADAWEDFEYDSNGRPTNCVHINAERFRSIATNSGDAHVPDKVCYSLRLELYT